MSKSYNWQRTALIILCVVLSLILVALIFATVYVNHLLDKIGRVDENYDATLSPEEIATATEELDDYEGETVSQDDITLDVVDKEEMVKEDHVVSILLVGQDRREGQGRQRSDAMILCTFNTATDTITLTSFLRDTYAYIPGYGYRKLNTAYLYGGFSLLNETLAVNFGVHVDANVEVDFSGFTKIIDLLGGVDIELTQAEADYMIKNGNFEYSDGSDWGLTAGVNHLTGDQALAYSRIRKLDSDFGRTQRQRKVIMALLSAYKDQSLGNMISMLDEILPLVTTNMTNQEILGYAAELFPMLAGSSINSQYIPAKGTYTNQYVSGVGAALVPDLEANRAILAQLYAVP